MKLVDLGGAFLEIISEPSIQRKLIRSASVMVDQGDCYLQKNILIYCTLGDFNEIFGGRISI